ncbi:lipopolysaccharide biosynthesis protein [Spiribacter vilamensis]|nr:oligosaccharide flippase family protein [Spiribacter vilamensis]
MAAEKLKKTARRLLPRNRFARSVSILAGGTAAGQIIVVAASPILTRLYSPEDFGVLAVFASLLGILGVIASLRYQLAIPLPETDEEAANVTALSLVVVLGMALLTAVIAIPFRQPIADALNTPLLADYIWLLPLGLLLMGIYQVFNYWAIRNKAFGVLAQTKLTQSVGMVVVQIGGYALGPIALLIGRIVGQAAGIFSLSTTVINKHRGQFLEVTFSKLAGSTKNHRSFPLISTWSGLCSSGGSQLPPLLIAVILGPGAAGFYALTNRVLSLPVGVISKSMGDVFYGEAIEANKRESLGFLVVDIYSKMVAASLPIAAVLFFSAPEAFRLIFGEDWAKSGELASWMILWVFFQVVTTPLGKVFLILDRHGSALLFQLAFLVTTVISIIIGGLWFEDLIVLVAIMATGRSAVYCFRLGKILKISEERIRELWHPIFSNLPYAALCASPVIFSVNLLSETAYEKYIKFFLFCLSFLMSAVPLLKIFAKR